MKTLLRNSAVILLAICSFSACRKANDDHSRYHLLPGHWELTMVGVDANSNTAPEAEELMPVETMMPVPGVDIPMELHFRKNWKGTATLRYEQYTFNMEFDWMLHENQRTLQIKMGEQELELDINTMTASSITFFTYLLPEGGWIVFERRH